MGTAITLPTRFLPGPAGDKQTDPEAAKRLRKYHDARDAYKRTTPVNHNGLGRLYYYLTGSIAPASDELAQAWRFNGDNTARMNREEIRDFYHSETGVSYFDSNAKVFVTDTTTGEGKWKPSRKITFSEYFKYLWKEVGVWVGIRHEIENRCGTGDIREPFTTTSNPSEEMAANANTEYPILVFGDTQRVKLEGGYRWDFFGGPIPVPGQKWVTEHLGIFNMAVPIWGGFWSNATIEGGYRYGRTPLTGFTYGPNSYNAARHEFIHTGENDKPFTTTEKSCSLRLESNCVIIGPDNDVQVIEFKGADDNHYNEWTLIQFGIEGAAAKGTSSEIDAVERTRTAGTSHNGPLATRKYGTFMRIMMSKPAGGVSRPQYTLGLSGGWDQLGPADGMMFTRTKEVTTEEGLQRYQNPIADTKTMYKLSSSWEPNLSQLDASLGGQGWLGQELQFMVPGLLAAANMLVGGQSDRPRTEFKRTWAYSLLPMIAYRVPAGLLQAAHIFGGNPSTGGSDSFWGKTRCIMGYDFGVSTNAKAYSWAAKLGARYEFIEASVTLGGSSSDTFGGPTLGFEVKGIF